MPESAEDGPEGGAGRHARFCVHISPRAIEAEVQRQLRTLAAPGARALVVVRRLQEVIAALEAGSTHVAAEAYRRTLAEYDDIFEEAAYAAEDWR